MWHVAIEFRAFRGSVIKTGLIYFQIGALVIFTRTWRVHGSRFALCIDQLIKLFSWVEILLEGTGDRCWV